MFDKWRRYSYTAQKNQRYRLLKVILWFIALYIVYNLLAAFGFSTWSVENETMRNGIHAGDKIIFASYVFPGFVTDVKIDGRGIPYKRGDIVLVDLNHAKKYGFPLRSLDRIVRFFTAQRFCIFDKNEPVHIKRIIGLPGDEISMNNYVFTVRPFNESYSLSEFEMADKPYHLVIPEVSGIWDASIPFSGSIPAIKLAPDECFVVSDDRSNTNDSRTWGPVSPDTIKAKAVFRYWPIKRLGRP